MKETSKKQQNNHHSSVENAEPTPSNIIPKIIVGVLLLLVIVVGGWLIYKSVTGYGRRELTNDGQVYSLLFDRRAKEQIINDKQYLEGQDVPRENTLLVSVSRGDADPNCLVTSGEVAFLLDINGVSRAVCSVAPRTIYLASFDKDNTSYVVTVIAQDGVTAIDQETAEKIISSVEVVR